MMGGLLVRVGHPNQRRFVPWPSEDRQSRRKSLSSRVTHGDVDRWKAGRRREDLTVVSVRRIQIADQPWRVAPRRVDERVQLLRVHRRQHCGTKLLEILRFRFARAAVGSVVVGVFLSPFETELYRGMKAARTNDLLDRMNGSVAETGEVAIQIVLE